ncbi:radical SAM-modified peptide, FtsH ternary system-associated [Candidatus Accumulibacter phosphatis]|uniref:radical SAM-modified peptide, FtsH ternary system-associated n=1 Tax=Candidatus Accumulibacter phosphatis TaxID=327160 RepID=UPI00110A2963|nr:radical SAM-modified peptide, FtsH ternary system-associated [Candidatus Accumulibacter phosphatis]MCM8578845.1 hypothetical protein [Accumulibacter sp.]
MRRRHEVSHQPVLQRETGAPRFPDRLVDHADAQHQAGPFHQPLANTRQLQAQPKEDEDAGQQWTYPAPLAQLNDYEGDPAVRRVRVRLRVSPQELEIIGDAVRAAEIERMLCG